MLLLKSQRLFLVQRWGNVHFGLKIFYELGFGGNADIPAVVMYSPLIRPCNADERRFCDGERCEESTLA